MKKLLAVIGLFIGLLLLIYYTSLKPRLEVLTAFTAKNACSCHFISQRSFNEILSSEFSESPLNLASVKLDKENKRVHSSVYGLAPKKAVFKKDLGCQLIHGEDDNKVKFTRTTLTSESDSLSWPYGSQIKDFQIDDSVNRQLDDVYEKAFSPGSNTRALLVVKGDKLIKERYAEGFDNNTPQIGWSMTKSIANALIGILVNQGRMSLSDNKLFPGWTKDDRSSITLDNLLKMNSGLLWEEEYAKPSHVNNLLWREEDVVSYASSVPLEVEPGKNFYYSSGTSNLLSGLIRNQFKTLEEYHAFPYEALFNKLGMNSMQLETDEVGNYVLSSFAYATARDWAKFGLLYLQRGEWNGEQIIDPEWVEYSKTVSNSEKNYTAHFWSNESGDMKDVPLSMYSANGYNGQRVIILPDQDLVIVRLGLKEEIDWNAIISGIIKALK